MTKKIKKWKTLSSKLILDHKQMKISEDIVELPNGKKSIYVRRTPSENDSVIIIAIDAMGKILIQQEYSYPPDKIMYQLPGGSMLSGETVLEAAHREAAEESGIDAKNAQIIGSYYVNNRLSDKKQNVVLFADIFKSKLKEDGDEFIETMWISEAKLFKMIASGKIDNINLLAAINIWLQKRLI
jgi:ADP-ribose pyrophosphatase